MFNINANSHAMAYAYHGENAEPTPLEEVEFVSGHAFDQDEFLGVFPCACCDEIHARFFGAWWSGDADSAIFVTSIKNVKEFTNCTTVEECTQVANAIISGNKKAA